MDPLISESHKLSTEESALILLSLTGCICKRVIPESVTKDPREYQTDNVRHYRRDYPALRREGRGERRNVPRLARRQGSPAAYDGLALRPYVRVTGGYLRTAAESVNYARPRGMRACGETRRTHATDHSTQGTTPSTHRGPAYGL